MEMLSMIFTLSMILWYLIDRFKPLWHDYAWGKWVTMGVALAASAGLCFSFGLDLIYAISLTAEVTVVGKAVTALAVASGSSAVSEIVAKIKTGQ